MGYTNHVYPTWEVAISLRTVPESSTGSERVLEGDIVACRPPSIGVGLLEMLGFLWLRVEGLEDSEAWLENVVPNYQKRQYQIPLERLALVYPAFDVAKARNPNVFYHPFLGLDIESGLFLFTEASLPVQGLVFDTITGEYL